MSVFDELAKLNDVYQSAEIKVKKSGEYEEIPDGKYRCIVDKLELKYSQAGNLMFVWDLKILTGQFSGQHFWKNQIMSKNGIEYLKGDFYRLNFDLSNLGDLENRSKELLDKIVDVTKKTKPNSDFVNYFFSDEIKDTVKSIEEDDVPF